MDIKARSKAVNIIFSILILLLTSFMFTSFFLPQLNFYEYGVLHKSFTAQDLFITAIKVVQVRYPVDIPSINQFVTEYCPYYVYIVFLPVTTIILFVNYIIVIVKTIQGLAGKDVNRTLCKRILVMVATSIIYISITIGMYYSRSINPTYSTECFPGYGVYGLAIACLILFIICAIVKISANDNKRPASRVLKVIISFLSLFASAIIFISPIILSNLKTYNLMEVLAITISAFAENIKGGSGTPDQILYSSIALFIVPALFVAQSTFNKMITGSFELDVDKEDKKTVKDVGGGLIAKSIVAMVFTVVGGFVLTYAIDTIYPVKFIIGYPMYISMGIAVICFVLSIIHKANSKKLKEEVEKGTSSTPKLEVKEEPKEKTPAVEIEPAEEVMDEGNVNNLDKESPIDKLGISIDDLMKK